MKPAREHATNNGQTYFVTSKTWEGRALFQAEPWARLFFRALLSHRPESYLLHEFVLMPDHFHLLMTPTISLERALQLIKGGFSFRAKKELGSSAEIWQRGFSDHRIRDAEDYEKHLHYIHLNPVKKHLCQKAEEYRFSSAYPGWKLDPIPQGLKPSEIGSGLGGTAEAVPFQNSATAQSEAVPFQNGSAAQPECVPFQTPRAQGLKPSEIGSGLGGTAEAVPFQNSATAQSEAVPFQNIVAPQAEAVLFQNSATAQSEALAFQNSAAAETEASPLPEISKHQSIL